MKNWSKYHSIYEHGSGYGTSKDLLKRYSARASIGSYGCPLQISINPSVKIGTRLSCKYYLIG